MKEKTCQLDEFCWLVLRSLVSQRLVLLTRRKKGKIMLPVCLLSAVWPQTPTTQALSTTRLLKTKRSIILSDFWFEDFLLVIIILIAELALLEIFEVQLFFPCYQRSFVCSAGSSSRVSNVFVINSTDKHCMQVGKSNTIPSAKT